VDVSNALDPESAAAIGVELNWLLWVRCGAADSEPQPTSATSDFSLPEKYRIPAPGIKGLHGGGHGPHPRAEAKGLSDAVGGFLQPGQSAHKAVFKGSAQGHNFSPADRVNQIHEALALDEYLSPVSANSATRSRTRSSPKPLTRIDQALRVTDLLLQAGGFSAIVLDMGSIAPADALRVPLATWFRYRAAAERTQASILLLTQHPCAKSSAGLLLRMKPGQALQEEPTLFTGLEHRVEVTRERFQPELNRSMLIGTATRMGTAFAEGGGGGNPREEAAQTTGALAAETQPTASNVLPMRKPPQSERGTSWKSRANLVGGR
jgi:hypothetical protein